MGQLLFLHVFHWQMRPDLLTFHTHTLTPLSVARHVAARGMVRIDAGDTHLASPSYLAATWRAVGKGVTMWGVRRSHLGVVRIGKFIIEILNLTN